MFINLRKKWVALSCIAICFQSLVLASGAQAGIKVHDSAADFEVLNYSPVGSIAASRQIQGNLFDNDNSTLLTLGFGGYLEALISPSENVITSGTVVELTNGNTHAESADVYLGKDLANWINIGSLLGNANNGGNDVVNNGNGFATLSVGPNNNASVFSISVISGMFNSFKIIDTTLNIQNTQSSDGFDIASFSITSVPAPGGLGAIAFLMFGAVSYLRRKAA